MEDSRCAFISLHLLTPETLWHLKGERALSVFLQNPPRTLDLVVEQVMAVASHARTVRIAHLSRVDTTHLDLDQSICPVRVHSSDICHSSEKIGKGLF